MDISSECESLRFESFLSDMKEREKENMPNKTVECVIHGVRKDIPNTEYVKWLEGRVDHWMTLCAEGQFDKFR